MAYHTDRSTHVTLCDHAIAWGKENGIKIPERGDGWGEEWRTFYDAWYKFAFADFAPERPYNYMLHTLRKSQRRNEMLLSERQKFGPMACAWLETLPGIIRDTSYDFKIDTIYGPLSISAYDHEVMTRFDDAEQAMPCTHSHTGKWNHYHFSVSSDRITAMDLLEYFQRLLIPLLKQKPVVQFPLRILYHGDEGKVLALVLEMHKGFKSYWIEDSAGKKLTKPAFYAPEAIRLIVEKTGYGF
jgi:hypothetical protein